jgi:hypothetical protein
MGYWNGTSFVESQRDYVFQGRQDAEHGVPARTVGASFQQSYTDGYTQGLYFRDNIWRTRNAI